MAGIIILLILGAWFYICKRLSRLLVACIDNEKIKTVSKWMLFAVLLTAPVIDEIIGGFQFRVLCSTDEMITYDANKIKNKVLLISPVSKINRENYFIPIKETTFGGFDVLTQELIIEYKRYTASGGWLSQLIAYDSSTRPFTFEGVCGVKNELALMKNKLKVKFEYK